MLYEKTYENDDFNFKIIILIILFKTIRLVADPLPGVTLNRRSCLRRSAVWGLKYDEHVVEL